MYGKFSLVQSRISQITPPPPPPPPPKKKVRHRTDFEADLWPEIRDFFGGSKIPLAKFELKMSDLNKNFNSRCLISPTVPHHTT